MLDMGTGITDAHGELASSGAGIPAFVGVLDKAVKVILARHPRAGIRPGDVFATNDPYFGGVTHLNDIIVAMPVFAEDRLIAWRTLAPFPLTLLFTGRTWRYELEPVEGGTLVRETWDLSTEARLGRPAVRRMAGTTRRNMDRTLARIEELVTT